MKSKKVNKEELVISLLTDYQSTPNLDLRKKVLKLVPIWDGVAEIGKSLIPKTSARDRILYYFQKYPLTVISHRELMVIAGISEWARRVRELRVESGWPILNGQTAMEMQNDGDFLNESGKCIKMSKKDYIMLNLPQDREAAHRWHIAKSIRNSKGGSKRKILDFFIQNVNKPVTGEELRYVAKDASEWARRVRELRTEDGWQIVTHFTGRPDLPVGEYILETLDQLPAHDRNISDRDRKVVLERDKFKCQKCGWNRAMWNPDLPRHLEIHHIDPISKGGSNLIKNLITFCDTCHDELHKNMNKKK